jgi:hypothetical protein
MVMARNIGEVFLLGVVFCVLWSAKEAPAAWYLMEPPSVQTPAQQLYLAAPLSQWIVLESFDRVSDCEGARRVARRSGRGHRSPVCIATDDARLAVDARSVVRTQFWLAQIPVCCGATGRPSRSLGR